MHQDNLDPSSPRAAPRLTPWIDGATPPAREGVYRRRSPAGIYACWDGSTWYVDSSTPGAAAAQVERSVRQKAPWRGLSMAPAAPCFACRGHTVIDRGVDAKSGRDLIEECPEC
ncbi:MAG: hypothetical protein ABI330_04995 [Caldimonas sp.]